MKLLIRVFTLSLSLSVLLILTASASKWRVNNSGIQAGFNSVQQAVSSSQVLPGDTLYVEGSPFSYGNVDLTKRLVIIGPGYFLGQNPETQACLSTAIFENIAFNAESDGSFMTGMTVIS